MNQWRKDARKEPIIIDIDSLVPADHLLRKIEKVMDYEWLYEQLDPYYCHDNGRPGTDPVADAKEKHAMRYTHHRGLAAVTRWVRLKYAAMNLKKLANWSWNNSFIPRILLLFCPEYVKTPAFA